MFEFGVGYSEMFVLAVVAVIVIGPKDLPVVLRKIGQFMAKARGMAREFQSHVDVAMKDAGVDGLKTDLKALRTGLNSSMSGAVANLPDIKAPPLPVTPAKAAGFEEAFGPEPSAGETRVAGKLVKLTPADPTP